MNYGVLSALAILVSIMVWFAFHEERAYYGPSDTLAFSFAERVEHSGGGFVLLTRAVLLAAGAAGHKQVIDGTCLSACTLVLSHDHVCWTERAVFRFHGASLDGADSREGTQDFLDMLPKEVSAALPAAEKLHTRRWVSISGKEMGKILRRDLCE